MASDREVDGVEDLMLGLAKIRVLLRRFGDLIRSPCPVHILLLSGEIRG